METTRRVQMEPHVQRSSEVHELRDAGDTQVDGPQREFSLPRADGGKDAWLFLAGCFFVEALVWGFPFSYGIFQEYYSTHEPFASHPSGIAVIGTSAMGIMYLSSPFTFMALQRYPNRRRQSCALGLALVTIGLLASSFSQKVWHLVLTQGVLYAIGGGLLYCPVILFLDEWFIRKKGFAFGIMWAGTGASGVAVPYLMSWGLEHYTFRTMLRAWAVSVVILTGPLLVFVKPRLPVTMASSDAFRRRFDYRFTLTPQFLFLEAGNILQGLGFFVPGIYLPTYAKSLGVSSGAATATLALLNTMSVFGCVLVGVLVDRLHVTTVILITTIGSALAVFIFWGLSMTTPLLLLFSALYGFFAGSFSSTWTGIIREVVKKDPSAEAGLVFGLLAAGRGIGSVACGPVSESILGSSGKWSADAGYGSDYGPLIVFTGVSVALGGLSWGARRAGWI